MLVGKHNTVDSGEVCGADWTPPVLLCPHRTNGHREGGWAGAFLLIFHTRKKAVVVPLERVGTRESESI